MFAKLRLNLNISRLAREAAANGSWGSAKTAPALEAALRRASEHIKRTGRRTFLSLTTKQVLADFIVAYTRRTAETLQEKGYFWLSRDNEPYARVVMMAASLLSTQDWHPATPEERLLTALSCRDWDQVRSFGSQAAEFILCEGSWRGLGDQVDWWGQEDRARAKELALELAKPVASERRTKLYKALLEKFQHDRHDIILCLTMLKAASNSEFFDKSPHTWCSVSFEEVLYFLKFLSPPLTDKRLFEPRNRDVGTAVRMSSLPDVRSEPDETLAQLGIERFAVRFGYQDAYDGSYAYTSGSEGFVYVRRVDDSRYAVIYTKQTMPGNYEGLIYERYPDDARFPRVDVTRSDEEHSWKDYNCVT